MADKLAELAALEGLSSGVKLVFKVKQKVKQGEKGEPGKIPEPCCSKGHRVSSFDKYW